MRDATLREYLAASFNLLPTAIHDAFSSALFGRLLVTALRLGFFEALKTRGATSAELASSLGLPLEPVDLTARALASAGYLKKGRRGFSLTRQSRKWLLASSPYSIGNFLCYVELLHTHWLSLEDSLRHGKPRRSYVELFGEEEWTTYTLGMMELSRLIIPRVLPHLKIPEGARTLLDACGSHGLYAIELLKRHPRLSAVVADLPQVTPIAEKIIASHGLAGRCTVLPCDVTRTDFGERKYDVVLAFNIIHGFPPQVNNSFIASLHRSMTRGGTIALLDQLIEEGRRGAGGLLPLMVGINLINEIGGRAYSFREVRAWLVSAGFSGVVCRRLGLPGVHLVQARKA